ncbi:hypothetical protein, unlikely [Trypanosoma brucei brucei TREU927]|uniref:Uncharacterized protein n=1 Tax=Trypanosoma brucei brucei (strain 927/4 GUTat10.1) TaxID=185431 RepID=Q38EX4_TRYB2|nr:hypothetical protein, unlikely [Trypanosoma brucei brucei TREU927]EAN76646.1 hypothetical protein, unlikely [Trypanosoma brucei brucei TREU927]
MCVVCMWGRQHINFICAFPPPPPLLLPPFFPSKSAETKNNGYDDDTEEDGRVDALVEVKVVGKGENVKLR